RPWFGDAAETGFPYLRRRGPAAIINLRSGWPTPPLLSGGRLGEAQLRRFATMLQACGEEGLVRIVLLHHPIAEGAASPRQALFDAAALRATLKEHGAELVLHGHVHFPEPAAIPGPEGAIPVLGVSSASARSHGNPQARWHGIEIEGAGPAARLQLMVRGFEADGDRIVELDRRPLKP
ncbi:MAG: metallophosphoesterase, partial [Caulobacteraceae bacterium]